MSSKKETVFSNNLNSLISKGIYKEKTNNKFRRGVPDFYLEGAGGNILWREDKFIDKPWTAYVPPDKICNTVSWVHQHIWLARAHNNEVPTCVVVGAPKLAVLLEYPYEFDPTRHQFEARRNVATKIEALLRWK